MRCVQLFDSVSVSFGPSDPQWHEEPDQIKENLDPTEDGEAGEEAHGASNQPELSLQSQLSISLDLIVAGRHKEDLD